MPVVVLSTSSRDSDKQLAYALGATYYVSKRSNFEQLMEEITEVYRPLTSVAAHRNAAGRHDDAHLSSDSYIPQHAKTPALRELIPILVVLGARR